MNPDDELAAATLVDLVFPVRGETLLRDHRALLARALAARLPWLGVAAGTGVHRLNVVAGLGAQALLSGRTRLVLRVPRERAAAAAAELANAEIEVGADRLRLGVPHLRELGAYRTLYSHFVAAASDDEAVFMADVDAELRQLGIDCRTICGRRQRVRAGGAELPGFSLMLDGLSAGDAQRVLHRGLGPERGLGCGLFVPHKSAAAVGS